MPHSTAEPAEPAEHRDEAEFVEADEAAEVIDVEAADDPMDGDGDDGDDDGDELMDDDNEEINLRNDSVAYFDGHADSVFCVAAHPTAPNVVATGGGDDVAFVLDVTSAGTDGDDNGIAPIATLKKHADSVIDVAFSNPDGRFVITAGMDGAVVVWDSLDNYAPVAEISEVSEVTWLRVCPDGTRHANAFAFGSSDGSVWVYTIRADGTGPDSVWLEQVASYFPPDECSSTAAAWSPRTAAASLLATVSDRSRLTVYDPFGDLSPSTSTPVITATPDDARFNVDGGLYSVAVSPSGAAVAVGGADGHIRVLALPRPNSSNASAGTILASMAVQSDSVETLAFTPTTPKSANIPSIPLLVAGSVDGSLAIFDVATSYALRRHIVDAHDGHAVVSAQFSTPTRTAPAVVTTCGNDGVVRRWDLRGGTAAPAPVPTTTSTSNPSTAAATATTTRAANPPTKEWHGHRGGGDGGGVLGFVTGVPKQQPNSQQHNPDSDGGWIVTAGDE